MFKTKLFFIVFLLACSAFAQIKNPRNIPYNWKTDTTKTTIDLSELMSVLPRGNFQVLNYPAFIGRTEGLKTFFAREPIMAVEKNGFAKAYPLNMLSTHEIANDTLAGTPLLVTFCPLCNSGIVYDRRLTFNDKEYLLYFEVSGMLRNSDMVLADRQTETWWQQLTGTGIVGELAGAELKIIPSLIISVEEFFNRYPDGKILSKKTGIKNAEASYGYNYYEHYDHPDGKPYDRFFDSDKIDSRLPPMERVVDIRSRGEFKIYPFSILKEKRVINDEFNSKHVVLFFKPGMVSILDEKDITRSDDVGFATVFNAELDGRLLKFTIENEKFVDTATHSIWDITGRCVDGKLKGKQLALEPYGNHFAFAWLAFHPETKIYGSN
ncbi:MAG: DUF3179 domain-containing protein [bacterium]|nr:DUF3179 domain-containing protein [bacterium]